MSDAPVAAPAPAKAAKAPKKKADSKPKAPASHPKYSEMVSQAISSLKERGGSSRQAILNKPIYFIISFDFTDIRKIQTP